MSGYPEDGMSIGVRVGQLAPWMMPPDDFQAPSMQSQSQSQSQQHNQANAQHRMVKNEKTIDPRQIQGLDSSLEMHQQVCEGSVLLLPRYLNKSTI